MWRYSNKHLPNIFRMRFIDSEWFQSDILDLHIDFRYFSKKSQNRFLQRISLLAENIPLFLPRSSDMVKPLLGLCRVDPGDAFTYLSWSHIMSRSNFRIREKKFSNFTFYAYFYKGNFKAPVEKLFSAHLTNFFHRILKIFLISKTISTWVLEVFLDDAEQVFILVFDVWMRFRQNRSKLRSVPHPLPHLSDELQWTHTQRWYTRISTFCIFSRFSVSGLQIEKFKMKTYSAWCKNTSRTQVDIVFDIRKIFKIRRKNFVFSAENMLSGSALKFPLIKYA